MGIAYVTFELSAALELLAHFQLEKDSFQMNKDFKSATSYRIQTFSQPSNMNPSCAYINTPSLRVGHLLRTATFARSVLHVKQLLISHSSSTPTFITASHNPVSPSGEHGRANQLSLESAPPRELFWLSPIEGSRCPEYIRVEKSLLFP